MTDRSVSQRVRSLVEEPLAGHGVELVEVEQTGTLLRITVDSPDGMDLDEIARVTRLVSEVLDANDPLPGRYTLEVSSPGLERPLVTPAHFARFIGSRVAVKLKPGLGGDRRLEGPLESADGSGIVVSGRRLAHDDIERARTVFVWPATTSAGGRP